MTFFYAQISRDGIAYAVTQTAAALSAQGLVLLSSYDTSMLGKRWTGANWEAVEQEPMPLDLRITKLAFRNRFTSAEKVAIEIAALDDPSAPMLQRQQSAAVRAYLADVSAATFIDLGRTDVQEGVQALETGGLIGAGRADEVLSAEIANVERYVG